MTLSAMNKQLPATHARQDTLQVVTQSATTATAGHAGVVRATDMLREINMRGSDCETGERDGSRRSSGGDSGVILQGEERELGNRQTGKECMLQTLLLG